MNGHQEKKKNLLYVQNVNRHIGINQRESKNVNNSEKSIKHKNLINNMKKLVILIGLLCLSFVGAISCENPGLPNSQIVNVKTNLIQTCVTCTYVNISSITTPNSTEYINIGMTKLGTTYNYSYIPNQQGTYYYSVIGDKDGTLTEETLCFEVTKTGTTLTIEESLIYSILAFGVLLLFFLSFYFMISTPYGNNVDNGGTVIKISKLKYVKLGLILSTWILFTWFLNILIGLSDNFVNLTMYYGLFGFMFNLMNRLSLPLGIVIMVISIFEIIRDANIMKAIKKFGSSK